MAAVAARWLAQSSAQQQWMCACLQVPKTLLEALPPEEKALTRRHVGFFQLRALQGVQELRGQFVGSTVSSQVSPLWLTPYQGSKVVPKQPTAKQLRQEVHAPWGIKRKTKLPAVKVGRQKPETMDPSSKSSRGRRRGTICIGPPTLYSNPKAQSRVKVHKLHGIMHTAVI